MSLYKTCYPWLCLAITIAATRSAGLFMLEDHDWWSFVFLFLLAVFSLTQAIESFFDALPEMSQDEMADDLDGLSCDTRKSSDPSKKDNDL